MEVIETKINNCTTLKELDEVEQKYCTALIRQPDLIKVIYNKRKDIIDRCINEGKIVV
ncbi:MAG: hypothetical protein PHS93_09165 [Candidatus Omnitrophica bacterium]|nr:hypothetical protein [Candidatus Omnitrophota bacterium]